MEVCFIFNIGNRYSK